MKHEAIANNSGAYYRKCHYEKIPGSRVRAPENPITAWLYTIHYHFSPALLAGAHKAAPRRPRHNNKDDSEQLAADCAAAHARMHVTISRRRGIGQANYRVEHARPGRRKPAEDSHGTRVAGPRFDSHPPPAAAAPSTVEKLSRVASPMCV